MDGGPTFDKLLFEDFAYSLHYTPLESLAQLIFIVSAGDNLQWLFGVRGIVILLL